MAAEQRRSPLPGDIIYWDGINPDNTKETPCYYVVMSPEETGVEDLCLVDGDHNFFYPDNRYHSHLKLINRETLDQKLFAALPPILKSYHKKYLPEI
ncbi:hypothetical protein J4437_01395 [Candidatus Woesearchaeota archaeon]|nr:hypothetical protein [Candidatus Woesearchaeota archaeon]